MLLRKRIKETEKGIYVINESPAGSKLSYAPIHLNEHGADNSAMQICLILPLMQKGRIIFYH